MPEIEGSFNVADLVAELDSFHTPTTLNITAAAPTPTTPAPVPPPKRSYSIMKIVPMVESTEAAAVEVKWWMKPVYLYVVWPVCGAVVGVLISMLMNLAWQELFVHSK